MTTALKYVKIGHVCISLTDFYESDKEAAMSLLQAILMGIIQGRLGAGTGTYGVFAGEQFRASGTF